MVKYIYDKEKFNKASIESIDAMIETNVDKEILDLATQMNKNGLPIYSPNQIAQIAAGYKNGLNKEFIKYYSKLNDQEKPIYDAESMSYIRYGIENDLPLEYIDIYARLKDEAPIFTDFEMKKIQQYITRLFKDNEIEKIKQLKECVDEGVSFYKIDLLITFDVPVDKARIFRSFYKMRVAATDVRNLIVNNASYDDLKEMKFLLRCAEYFNIHPDWILPVNGNNPTAYDAMLIRSGLTSHICRRRMKGGEASDIIYKCLSCKLSPEQLDYMTNEDDHFNSKEMKAIANGLLKGLTIEEVKRIVHENRRDLDRTLPEALEDATRMKFNDISDIDTGIEGFVSLFDEIDR